MESEGLKDSADKQLTYLAMTIPTLLAPLCYFEIGQDSRL